MSKRTQIVKIAKSHVGEKESDGSFKGIIDNYNKHRPDGSYKMQYSDHWCACFASEIAMEAGASDVVPISVNVPAMVAGFKKLGAWVEDDGYKPTPGDYIIYDWQDSGKGDNTGDPDHIGIVVKVKGSTILVVEGNIHEAVGYREIRTNGRYIRGYGVPKYDKSSGQEKKPADKPKKKPAAVTAQDVAKSQDKDLAGEYKVTAESGLNVRTGAGTTKKILVAIPKGKTVECYGYYTKAQGKKWLYVQFTHDGTKYTGFATAEYLKKA
jgi:hypothetical protein